MTSQRPGPVLAIPADLDALSIKQQNDQVRARSRPASALPIGAPKERI